MRFDEFNAFVLNPEMLARLSPIPSIMEDFTVSGKPILWVRLVALGQLCSAFVVREGPTVGITPEPYGGTELLQASRDEFLEANHDRYRQMLENVASSITPFIG
jgi:hypothetical protein